MQQHSAKHPCWYAVLGVSRDASHEEVRQAFRQAALRLHPDKASRVASSSSSGGGGMAGGGSCENGNSGSSSPGDYILVQQAWEVLQDGDRRAAYDRQLALAEAVQEVHIHETVPLGDMTADAVQGLPCFCWPCRCSGSYVLLEEDAEAAAAAQAAGLSAAAATATASADPGAATTAAAAAVEPEVVVPCDTCSLHIRVLLNS